jgi:hypothetical protein
MTKSMTRRRGQNLLAWFLALGQIILLISLAAGCAPKTGRPDLPEGWNVWAGDTWCGFPVDKFVDLESGKIGRCPPMPDANEYE